MNFLKKPLENPFLLSLSLIVGFTLVGYLTLESMRNSEGSAALESRLFSLEAKMDTHTRQKKAFETLSVQLDKGDPSFIEKNIETLVFLEQEKMRVEQLFEDRANLEFVKKKEFLNSPTSNKIAFHSRLIKSLFPYNEILLEQKEPVEINDEDLKKLLSLIEGTKIFPYAPVKQRPQLVIKELSLKKISLLPYQNVFQVQMKILKREKIHHETRRP